MNKTCSPLRYPGGKRCLFPLVSQVMRENDIIQRPYAEPFAGGCGLALALLYRSFVSDIHINDIDPSIWSFWHSVLNETEEMVERVLSADVSVEEWKRQREIYLERNLNDPVSLGFSAFFLNRTNRSGIIKGAGVIGGLEQNGKYKIDCRFNRDDLARRIRRVSKYKRRINLSNLDAIDFIIDCERNLPNKSLICIDPPYFNKGSSLYTSFYKKNDHKLLSKQILSLDRPWILTYDDSSEIRSLYSTTNTFLFDVKYSLQTKRIGTELLFTSPNLLLPDSILERSVA